MTQTIPFFQVDAFADRPLTGNPAAVMPLSAWLTDETLQSIAAENNLSETAFTVPSERDDADYDLRWFTPLTEVPLCVHATFAAGHILIHGETVGQVVGDVTFVPGRGVQLNAFNSHIRYLLPATVSTGEYSMDVEGLRANGPGDKAKVFGMQEGQGDFITNDYRIDIQYRGSAGFPPNAIQWRVIYGGESGLLDSLLSREGDGPLEARAAVLRTLLESKGWRE